MDKEMYERLVAKGKTSKGFDIDYAIQAGVILPHVGVGIVNDGVESLNLYKELYDKIVEGWHGFKPEQNHKSNMNPNDLTPFSIDQDTINK
jgi:creatine kinase